MTLYADDPDVSRTFIVKAKTGDLSWANPVVKVNGFNDIAASWLGSPGSTRSLKVPLYGLPANVRLWLRLDVPDDNDIELGSIAMDQSDPLWEWPGQPGGTDLGSVGSALLIDRAGTYELDLTGNLAVTVTTNGDVSMRVHGTGQVTVAGETFAVDGIAVILVVSWPRGRDAYLIGEGAGTPVDPGDTTPPTAGTLTATGGQGQVSLSVSGAADETALHATPYSFSVNGGTTYGAWQSGSSAVITGLNAGVVTCRHRVRDSAGNISLGATKTATVTAPPGWSNLIVDTFTGADGNITSHAPDTGSVGGWRSGPSWQEPSGSTIDSWAIVGNKVAEASGGYLPYNSLPIGSATRSGLGVKVDYTLVTQSDTSEPNFTLALGSHLTVKLAKVGGALTADNGGGGGAITLTGTTTGLPTSGNLSVRCTGTALSIRIDGTEVATGALSVSHNNDTFVGLYMASCKQSSFDNFTVEVYA